ncbi:hypothetical protein INR49_024883, partial [Caranx melampygus]
VRESGSKSEQWTKVSHKFTIRGCLAQQPGLPGPGYELLQSQGAFGSDDHCLNGCLDDAEGGRGPGRKLRLIQEVVRHCCMKKYRTWRLAVNNKLAVPGRGATEVE